MTDDDIDWVAVERACKGDRSVSLNGAEVAAAVELCRRHGLSDGTAAALLGIASRTVLRVRSGATTNPFSRPGATVDTAKEKVTASREDSRQGTSHAPPPPPEPAAPSKPVGPEWYTIAEVADLLRVSRMTAYRLANTGELPSHRIGRSMRIHRDNLAGYMRGAEIRP